MSIGICDNCKKTKDLSISVINMGERDFFLGLCNECQVESIDIPVEFVAFYDYLDAHESGDEAKARKAWKHYLEAGN
jgi:hypothetical protein